MTIQLASPDDIFLWPCGTKCYRSEYERGHYQQMSDDFEVVAVDSPRYSSVDGDDEFSSLETSEADAKELPHA
jgi:hypothetical protein